MELSNYFKLLNKYKYIVVAIVLTTVIAAYFLVKNLPDEYVSRAQIATGIVDASRHLLDKDNNPSAQADQITREFSNLTEILKLKKLVDQVSYQLIIHDLDNPDPFRHLNHQFKNLSQGAIDHALLVYKTKLKNMQPLSLYNQDENGLNQLLISMGYDERSLRKYLDVTRAEESDFIAVTYTSENPQLSAFVVNTLCKEFIGYYTSNVNQNESNAIDFLTKLLADKKKALEDKKDSLQLYKIQNGILNIDEQSKAIFALKLNYEDRKIEAERNIASYDGAVKNIDNKFDPKSRQYIEAAFSKFNQDISNTLDEQRALTDESVRSGFNPVYQPKLDSLRTEITNKFNLSSDKYISNPLVAKDALVLKKMDLEVQRDLAKYSVKAIDKAIAELSGKFSRLVPFDATVRTYEYDIDIASKEYLNVLAKYNETNVQSNFAIKLNLVEQALPDVAQPSKKIILIVFCGLVSLVLCLLVLFVLFYLDDNIAEPTELVNRTQLPLLGALNIIPGPKPDLRKLWDIDQRTKTKQFKELLRSIRFEIDQELKGEKVLGITSLVEYEGKTLITMSLAYSYAAINKKVLIIDGNFENPTLSRTIEPKLYIEDYFRNATYIDREVNDISILGNYGSDISLLEINDEDHIQKALNDLKSRFDIILIDMPPLNSLNKSKEWMLFTNKIVGVFGANKSISKSQQNQYITYLHHLHGKFAGWILNKAIVDGQSKRSKK